MTLPDAQTLYRVTEATWPPASQQELGGWTIRRGAGGGSRVSAATLSDPGGDLPDVAGAERAMDALGQDALFMIRTGDEALDTQLDALGYAIKDPVTIYAARIADLAPAAPPAVTCFDIWPPLAAQAEIWAAGGIGPERLAVMTRAQDPKTSIFGRIDNRPAATAFVAIADGIAMLHALETLAAHRRKGLARHLMNAAAIWARGQGAETLSLLVTRANAPANALYASMGFQPVGNYHYRIKKAAR